MSRAQHRAAVVLVAAVAAAVAGARLAFASAKPIGSGVVVVDTDLAYQGGEAAGTGMVLTSGGEVLTNNHVIAGATGISVDVPGTGHRYTARVVGYSVAADVAVLQLQHASNLKTVTPSATRATVGQRVRAVGNAGGAGVLTTAAGRITGVGRSITASDESGVSEHLRGLLETNAAIQAGDSGGPLLDESGRVVGMDTAASRGGFGFGFAAQVTPDAYAVPIHTALAVAHQILHGTSTARVHVGPTPFLGVQVQQAVTSSGSAPGALIAGVVPRGPADSAGLQVGDVITAIDGKAVRKPTDIAPYVLGKKPGAAVSVRYVDQLGDTSTVSVSLGSGPPQ